MRRTPTFSTAAVLYIACLALILARTSVVVMAQDEDIETTADEEATPIPTLACSSICANEGDSIANPDATVTYDWAKRVPVPESTIAQTVQTMTCAEFDVRLTTFDENDCKKHQAGLQEAGCVCGSGSGATVLSTLAIAVMAVGAAVML